MISFLNFLVFEVYVLYLKLGRYLRKICYKFFVNFILSISAGATNQIQLSHHIIDFLKDKNSNVRDKCIFAQNKANYIRDTTF